MSRRSLIAVGVVALAVLIGGTLTVVLSRPSPTTSPKPDVFEPDGPVWFEDVTERMGLDFVHQAEQRPDQPLFMPRSVGSGVAVFDYDGDGRLDLYLVQNGGPKGPPNRLFHQEPDGHFKDVSAGSGADVSGYGMGAAVGDIDNDGRPDLLVTEYGGARLLRSLGGGKFQDVSVAAGVQNPLWATSAAFLDHDRDGWLDLIVINYVAYDPLQVCRGADGRDDFCGPNRFFGTPSKLFRNQGKQADGQVRFQDISAESGIGRLPGPGLGVAVFDCDGDGWPDIFVANDQKPNRLWINRRDGTFVDEAASRGIAYSQMGSAFAGMGVAVGDADGDLLTDVYVTHLGNETNTLWRQGPKGLFKDRTGEAGLLQTRWRGTGFGTLQADLDCDGHPDLAIVNGNVFRKQGESPGSGFWGPYEERNQLLRNQGDGRFVDISSRADPLCRDPGVHRVVARGDFDGDGAEDLVVTRIDGPVRLYRNVTNPRGHWLQVRVFDPRLNRDAYGAEVIVRAAGKAWLRVANPAESFLASSSLLLHFGLGATESVDTIEVTWPDGDKERFPGGAANRRLTVEKGKGTRP